MATVAQLDTIQSGAQAIMISSSVLLITYYTLNRRWLKSIWARMFISMDVGLWILDLPTCLRLWFHFNITNNFFAWYDAVSVWLVVAIIVWRTAAIIWIQFTRERRHREQVDHGDMPQGSVSGTSAEHGFRGDEEPPTLRTPHSRGN